MYACNTTTSNQVSDPNCSKESRQDSAPICTQPFKLRPVQMASSSRSRLSVRSHSRLPTQQSQLNANELFQTFINTTNCLDMVSGPGSVTIPADGTVHSASRQLHRHRVNCAPLHTSNRETPYTAVFTLKSLSRYLMSDTSLSAHRRSRAQSSMSTFNLRQFVNPSIAIDRPASQFVSQYSFVSCRQTDKLCIPIYSLTRRYDQVFVSNSRGELLGHISKDSLVTRFVMKNLRDLDRMFSGTVLQQFANCCRHSAYTLSEDVCLSTTTQPFFVPHSYSGKQQ